MVEIYGNSRLRRATIKDIQVTEVSINDSIQALETLSIYEMQQEDGSTSTLQLLDGIVRGFAASNARLTTQKLISSFFIRK